MIVDWPDLINGGFECIVGATVWLNIRQIYLDRRTYGIHLVPCVLFTMWSIWNLFYYPHLNQWISFIGSLNMALANCIWVGQMLYYRR